MSRGAPEKVDTDTLEHLESLIDKHGAARIVDALADISYQKANHIRNNWQDEISASAWHSLGTRLEKVSLVAPD